MIYDSKGIAFATTAEIVMLSGADGLGFCGCGDHDSVEAVVVTVLRWAGMDHHGPERPLYAGLDPLLFEFAWKVLERADWVAHGGRLTDSGRRALVGLTLDPCDLNAVTAWLEGR